MNWSYAKTVLIIFFMLLNSILLIDILYTDNQSTVVSPKIVSAARQVLAENNISIDEKLIPIRISAMKEVEVTNAIESYPSFAKKMMNTEDVIQENEYTYTATNQKITFVSDFFHYEVYEPILAEYTKEINQTNAEKISKRILKQYGFDMSDTESIVEQRMNHYVVKFTKNINQSPVFDSALFVVLSANGVSEIYGSWFVSNGKGGARNNLMLKNATSVLIDFISDQQRPQGAICITDLRLGYAVYENTQYHKTIMLVPVWQITLDNGMSYCLDARQTA